MTRILSILFLLLAGPAFAENLYVRPNGGSYGTEDGTSWANAFDGFSDVSWGSGTGSVGAGGYYDSQAGSGVFDVDATGWRLKMVFKFDETTDVFHRLGFLNAATVTTTTNEYAGVYLRFRSSTDSFFTFVARSAGAGPETTANSTVTADTGWHTLTIRSAAAGMYFSIDGETEQLVAGNIPTVGQLVWLAGTQTGTAKTIWMDYMEYSPQ